MSRAARLIALLQLLRSHRHAVGGAALAAGLGISLRTLYRDIATLQAQGASIDGAPGVGYRLRPGFLLPPLRLPPAPGAALALGARGGPARAAGDLAAAARAALVKIAAVLPPALRHELDSTALLVGPATTRSGDGAENDAWLAEIRAAIRREHTLLIGYANAQRETSVRTVWPVALGYFDHVRVLVAWCELRQAIRHFRCDRIGSLEAGGARYPRRRQALLAEWRAAQRIAEP